MADDTPPVDPDPDPPAPPDSKAGSIAGDVHPADDPDGPSAGAGGWYPDDAAQYPTGAPVGAAVGAAVGGGGQWPVGVPVGAGGYCTTGDGGLNAANAFASASSGDSGLYPAGIAPGACA